MPADDRPVVVAYDGSAEAQAAVRAAATLFTDRTLVIVSIWEPGIAMMMTPPSSDPTGLAYLPPSPEAMADMDRSQRDHAEATAAAGADLARGLGAVVEHYPVAAEADVAETVVAVADRRDAAALVVGSRGLGRVKGRLLGSVSTALLHHTRRPVLVVRSPD
jgi:nucleotide-binding universal stress UspA family protein